MGYAPHQEKLQNSPSFDYILPDTYLDWSEVTSNGSVNAKAAFVSVVREDDIYALRATMLDLERRLNHRHGYPWVIISERVMSRKFREWITSSTTAPVFFGQAPAIEWQEPYWIDIKLAEKNLRDLVREEDNENSQSMSYRRMTRYNTGFLAHHSLLKNLEFYWKVQPGARYTCDILQDPFEQMKKEKKKFSFAVTMTEHHKNVVGFQESVFEFIKENKGILKPVNKSIYKALLNDQSRYQSPNPSNPLGEYNGHFSNCMVYNNFMIASLDFLRSKEYTKYFDALDMSGGFFYQKWGDSMSQTVAAALLLERSELAYNHILGYEYKSAAICPTDFEVYVNAKCSCTQSDYRVNNMRFCTPLFMKAIDGRL
ncbi:nucleotide-diphospho-sugar transferase [Gilbertella persicaria]|uniref:nucleotide-diphospho-sugar transferase n=1 Tax=Gilbertella persicaria TaxID=101096 RepID=UPI002220F0EC|nr:nucleotide-diphospho-sugar transferase [Gilbertella persicaria]KAI8083406.1 nucleotide-diphospho-sugar transferase [Gilbertella persicaria]